jgi:hypothetical protein
MKLKYMCSIFMLLAVAFFVWSPQIRAQISGDNYTVQWQDNSGNVIPNALYNAVTGDTNTDGTRKDPNRVYILLAGGVYWNTEHIQNNGYALRIEGQTPDPSNPNKFPATIQIVQRSDGSEDTHILLGYGDVYMKNVYIIGSDNLGVQTNYQPIEFESNNATVRFDSCYFERSNFAITAWQGASGDNITFTNCKWYNLVERPITQQWTGRAVSIWADQDSVIIENCTVDNVGFTVLQIEGGAAKYIRFVHNTIINLGRGLTSAPWIREAYFADNLFINPFFDGEGYVDYNPVGNPSRYNYNTGFFSFSSLPSSYGPDLGRKIVFANNAAFLAQTFKNAWDDTVRIQPFCNATTDSFFNVYSPANGGTMVIKDTTWLTKVPSFTKYDTTNYGNMIAFIETIRKGITPAPQWMQDLYVDPSTGDTIWTAPQWPLVQNFAYSDVNLLTAGVEGNPLGDLNWFPTQLADWNAKHDQYVQTIQNVAPKPIQLTVDTTAEAEGGTVGGTAKVGTTPGLLYYDQNGGAGYILWTFTANATGQFDTRWLVNETGRGQSGPDLAIDGQQFVDKAHGWGQFVFDPNLGPAAGQPNNAWIWVPIVADSVELSSPGPFGNPANSLFTFTQGTQHTIGVVSGGWGEVQFSEIDLVVHGGTDTLKLKAPQALVKLVTPGAFPKPAYVASGFQFVNMGTSGTDTWVLNIPATGNYRLNAFYQNVSGPATAQVSVDGTPVLSNFGLSSNTDSTVLSTLSGSFALTAGAHTFVMSGAANVNLDYIQLISEGVTGIKQVNNVLKSYSLEQNYPNPFNPSTSIRFSLAQNSNVKLEIYNVLGQKVATLINNQNMNAGSYEFQFNASHLASGVYIYRIEAGKFNMAKKMLLLK